MMHSSVTACMSGFTPSRPVMCFLAACSHQLLSSYLVKAHKNEKRFCETKRNLPHFPITNTQSPSVSSTLSHEYQDEQWGRSVQSQHHRGTIIWKQSSAGQLLAGTDLPSLQHQSYGWARLGLVTLLSPNELQRKQRSAQIPATLQRSRVSHAMPEEDARLGSSF